MHKNPAVSVVVASHRPMLLSGLLRSLVLQHSLNFSFELIVVTDYQNGRFQNDFPDVHWVYLPDNSISKKRNTGALMAKAPLLAFIDDDCIAALDWVAQGYGYLVNHPEAAAVEGYTTIESTPEYSSEATREYRRLEKRGFRTNNLFLRTGVFKTVGGFDERFTVQREDLDLAFTLLEQGYVIDYCRAVRVTHRFRYWEKWDLLKNCWNRRFDPLLFRKHPRLYCSLSGFPLPPTQVAMLVLHLVMLLFAHRRRWLTTVAGIEVAAASILGLRRSGTRPFIPGKWFIESAQVMAAPLVVIAALVYGWMVSGKKHVNRCGT